MAMARFGTPVQAEHGGFRPACMYMSRFAMAMNKSFCRRAARERSAATSTYSTPIMCGNGTEASSMHRPDDFHETPDEQRPPQARPDSAPADRGGTRSGLTFSIKFEIGRSGPLLGRMRVERQARPAIANRIRGMLCRVLGEGLEPRRQSPTSPVGDRGSRLEEADADPPREPVVSRQARVSFWETLNPVERRALESLASWVRFPVGDTIMREGEPADYVLVIIEGRTRICVDENGWERILAERGPGDLVGERAGFQVRVRSASVIAAETVRALKVKTADFTAFVVDHPRV